MWRIISHPSGLWHSVDIHCWNVNLQIMTSKNKTYIGKTHKGAVKHIWCAAELKVSKATKNIDSTHSKAKWKWDENWKTKKKHWKVKHTISWMNVLKKNLFISLSLFLSFIIYPPGFLYHLFFLSLSFSLFLSLTHAHTHTLQATRRFFNSLQEVCGLTLDPNCHFNQAAEPQKQHVLLQNAWNAKSIFHWHHGNGAWRILLLQ